MDDTVTPSLAAPEASTPIHVQAAFGTAGVPKQSGYHGGHPGGYAAVRGLIEEEAEQVTEADQRTFYDENRRLFGERTYVNVELDIRNVLAIRRARARLLDEGLSVLDAYSLPGALDD